jgi:hypothetical protein
MNRSAYPRVTVFYTDPFEYDITYNVGILALSGSMVSAFGIIGSFWAMWHVVNTMDLGADSTLLWLFFYAILFVVCLIASVKSGSFTQYLFSEAKRMLGASYQIDTYTDQLVVCDIHGSKSQYQLAGLVSATLEKSAPGDPAGTVTATFRATKLELNGVFGADILHARLNERAALNHPVVQS